jgi:3-dehydroquinate synthase
VEAAITSRRSIRAFLPKPVPQADVEHLLDAAGIAHSALALPAGEVTKGWAQLARCTEWLLEAKVERRDVVVALGGGVIGDLVGFSAAILRRGVRFVQVPTTLLAQVDSSVGGKTGINTAQGKNLVGAFHQPSLVLADIDVLATLPARDFLSGYGEVVKYGLLGDAAFFDWLEANGPALAAGDAGLRHHAVRRSVEMKAGIVARDETETGDRALLNLGHTFGHALEALVEYDAARLVHGEAVALGLCAAAACAGAMGLITGPMVQEVTKVVASAGLPMRASGLPSIDVLIGLMQDDKKTSGGRLRVILPTSWGQSIILLAQHSFSPLVGQGRLTCRWQCPGKILENCKH